MPKTSKSGSSIEKSKRYLALNYGDEAQKDESKLTEREWLERERKEIEDIEKTVQIRFANYTTLVRAQTLTTGLSAGLSA